LPSLRDKRGRCAMKADIHPKYIECQVSCACGNKFKTRSVKAEIRTDICSNCHPFYTGAAKFVDAAGRVDKFLKRYGKGKEAAKT
jgi:large subunit ribosomal protein L31